MPARKGLLAPQNTFLDTIATRFDGTLKVIRNQLAMGRLPLTKRIIFYSSVLERFRDFVSKFYVKFYIFCVFRILDFVKFVIFHKILQFFIKFKR
uniref:Uncharacterized protein n=1 Tax=Strigamia maritima TaxID=126957 RepID=T1IPH6_STRMM